MTSPTPPQHTPDSSADTQQYAQTLPYGTPVAAQPAPEYAAQQPQQENYAATEQQPAYADAGYAVGQPTPAPAPQGTTLASTNTYALLAIIFAFIAPLAGIIFGHLGLNQIKRTGDAGRGIGLTGLIISYAYFIFIFLFIVVYIGAILLMFGAMGAAFADPYGYDSDFGYLN